MPVPRVWSERDEPGGGSWRDCTYASGLMALIYGGWTHFPAGIYTVAEREALERSDSRADESGANLDVLEEAVRNRYGVALHKPAAGVELRELLTEKGLAVILQGDYSAIAAGHPLRRWQPSYTGGHAVCVKTRADGKLRWLDPLAPMKSKGDVATVDLALAFARPGQGYQQRYVERDELISPHRWRNRLERRDARIKAAIAALQGAKK